jgi:type I restriction enzyme R subunit
VDLDEAATRVLIDQQMRDAGWEVDTKELRHPAGTRPQKGKFLAIAEWPTDEGPADYVLFDGLIALGVVEAKKARKDVSAALKQSKRYSRGFRAHSEAVLANGAWGEYRVPFLFATNGRPYLKQLETKSGIWFCDVRRPTNLARPLLGWYSPEGLKGLFKQNIDAAEQRLTDDPSDYLPLRKYQFAAIFAVEAAIRAGKTEVLLAMATGTGKTITAIALVYRLIKSQRFRRILFLVDRTALGEQAEGAFNETTLENLQKFTEIFDLKGLQALSPDTDTRLHIATVQGMVRRIVGADGPENVPPVDTYDCIVVDECHRGYGLDQEMSDAEMRLSDFGIRSQRDYISKYRRVLEYFDCVKIGPTATPALHTKQIFGDPVFNYDYREGVIDGFLIDHEPPVSLVTKLAESGIHWDKGAPRTTSPGSSASCVRT